MTDASWFFFVRRSFHRSQTGPRRNRSTPHTTGGRRWTPWKAASWCRRRISTVLARVSRERRRQFAIAVAPDGGYADLFLCLWNQRTLWPGLRCRRQPLRRRWRGAHGGQDDPSGHVSTFASGFPGSSAFASPTRLAFNLAGDLFVVAAVSATVNEMTPTGHVSTFVTRFDDPDGLAFDAHGNLYVANGGDQLVSEVTSAGKVSNFATEFDDPVSLAFNWLATSTSLAAKSTRWTT